MYNDFPFPKLYVNVITSIFPAIGYTRTYFTSSVASIEEVTKNWLYHHTELEKQLD